MRLLGNLDPGRIQFERLHRIIERAVPFLHGCINKGPIGQQNLTGAVQLNSLGEEIQRGVEILLSEGLVSLDLEGGCLPGSESWGYLLLWCQGLPRGRCFGRQVGNWFKSMPFAHT